VVWTREDPGAGEPSGIRHQATARTMRSASMQTVSSTLVTARSQADAAAWVGKSRDSFVAKLDSLAPELAYLVQSLNAQARSLNRYAAEVEQIQDEQRALERERTDAQATLDGYHRRFRELAVSFPNEELLPDPPGRAERAHLEEAMSDEKRVLQSIDIRWDELVSRRRAADSACGQQFGSVEVLGVLNAFTPTRITGLPADELLARLATLSAIDLAVLLAQYPLLTTQALQADPVRTAAWWRSLSGPDGAVGRDDEVPAYQPPLGGDQEGYIGYD